jgi:excisionase family DNA binding protein
MSLREAGRQTGISRQTLRRWLEDAGFLMPAIKRGSKILVSDSDLRVVLAIHTPRRAASV